jgi:hypothetical protein
MKKAYLTTIRDFEIALRLLRMVEIEKLNQNKDE